MIKQYKFIIVLGHGRSGTTLCSTLLNHCPSFNIAYERYNNHIVAGEFETRLLRPKIPCLPLEFNGNKVVLHHNLPYKNFMECLIKKYFIFHERWSDLYVIFTKRDAVNSIISRINRLKIKRAEILSVSRAVAEYRKSERTIRLLKKHFKEYHVFDFDKAVSCELHRKWLFDFVEEKYCSLYSDNYKGIKNYPYGSISPKNIMFSKEENPEVRKEIEDEFDRVRFWPWESREP